MALISIPNTFSAGAVIVASQHNLNFSTIYYDYNGNIDNTNIASGAAIAYSKLTLTGSIVNADVNASAAIAYSKLNLGTSIVNADVNASAAIVDTKLAQITTASKVSGTAITGLASLPSGAGVIPTANLPTLGALSYISTTNFTTSTDTTDIAITSTKQYLVKVVFTTISASDNIYLLFNNQSSNFTSSWSSRNKSGTTSSQNDINSGITMGTFAATNGYSHAEINIEPQTSGGTQSIIAWGSVTSPTINNGTMGRSDFFGNWVGSATATSFRLHTIGGANMSGSVYLYELKTS